MGIMKRRHPKRERWRVFARHEDSRFGSLLNSTIIWYPLPIPTPNPKRYTLLPLSLIAGARPAIS